MIERRIKLHHDGREQTIRLPGEFALPGNEAILRWDEGRLTLEAVDRPSLLATLSGLLPLNETWPEVEDRPPEPVDL
jgi:antitoxin VapB